MRTKLIHLRHQQPDTILNGSVKVGGISPLGGITVAYLEEDGIVYGFAAAKCHKKDNYNKQQGRVKAEGRLKSPHYFMELRMRETDFFVRMNEFWKEEQNNPGQFTPAHPSITV